MARTKLLHQALNHLHNVEALRVCRSNIRVEHDLQQHVAQLLTQQRHIRLAAGFYRLDNLVGFLHQVANQGGVGLLGVPGATSGSAQAGHRLNERLEGPSGSTGGVFAAPGGGQIGSDGGISHSGLPHRKCEYSAPRRPPHGEPARLKWF